MELVDSGIGGWIPDGTPKAALTPVSEIRFVPTWSISFFDQPTALSKSHLPNV